MHKQKQPAASPMQGLRERSWPLAGRIEPGSGVRIGSPEWTFSPTEACGDTFTVVDPAHALCIRTTLEWRASTVVINQRLENLAPVESPPLDLLEPLCLTLIGAPVQWRHLFASGGTAESFYPPLAFCTHERTEVERELVIESNALGKSSEQHLPFLISLADTTPDSAGFFCGLEWSGAWYLKVAPAGADRICLSAGVKVKGLRLAAGEALVLPPVHLGGFTGGPAGGTNALRRYLYDYICPPYQGHPTRPRVSYDHWFGIGNRLNLDLLRKQARRAAELGVEVFVVDAAWFPGGFPDGVGNWHAVNEEKFPGGLAVLADEVRRLGMDFGLWFEIERAAEDSSFRRDHPDWFVPVPCWTTKPSYHLNLAIPAAQDYVIELVSGWITRLDLRWSRWDYNVDPGPFWEATDPTGKLQFAYYHGLYRVLDTLMARHPNWMVEACASGGRRIDLGTLRRAHTIWISDQSEKPNVCRYMQARANRFLPGHLLNSSVAVGTAQGDRGFDDTAVLSRMLGKLAFDGDVASWSPVWTARARRWADAFKATRHLLVQDFYQLLPLPTTADDTDALEFVSRDGREALVFAFAGRLGEKRRLPLHGLLADTRYRLAPLPDGAPACHHGAELMNVGLLADIPPREGRLWHLAVDQDRTHAR